MNPLVYSAMHSLQKLLGSRLNLILSQDWEEACSILDHMEISYEHPDIRVSLYYGKEREEHHIPCEIPISPVLLCELLTGLLGIAFTSTMDNDSGDFKIRMGGLEVHFLHLLIPYGMVMLETEEGMFKEDILVRLCSNARTEFYLS